MDQAERSLSSAIAQRREEQARAAEEGAAIRLKALEEIDAFYAESIKIEEEYQQNVVEAREDYASEILKIEEDSAQGLDRCAGRLSRAVGQA